MRQPATNTPGVPNDAAMRRSRAEQRWRQTYRGSDRDSEAARAAWQRLQRANDDYALPQRIAPQRRGARPAARREVLEDDAPRVASGAGIALDREVIEAWGREVIITDSTGAEIDRLVEWQRYRLRDAGGNEFELDLAQATRTDNVTPA